MKTREQARNWRRTVKTHRKNACEWCGSTVIPTLHHIDVNYRSGYYDPRNLITLCKHCHYCVHNAPEVF